MGSIGTEELTSKGAGWCWGQVLGQVEWGAEPAAPRGSVARVTPAVPEYYKLATDIHIKGINILF